MLPPEAGSEPYDRLVWGPAAQTDIVNSRAKASIIANYVLGKDVAVKSIKNASGKNFSKNFYDEIILDANLQDYMFNRYYKFVEPYR